MSGSKKQKKNSLKSQLEIYQGMRKDWGLVNPVSRIHADKRKKKPKYKNLEEE